MDETFDFVVKRPRKDVFQGLTDMEMMARFAGAPDAPVKVSVTALPDRPKTGLGSGVTIKVEGAGMDLLMETVEWDPPSRCVRALKSADLDGKVAFDFADDPAGTKVSARLTLEAKSFLLKMMLPVMAKKLAAEKGKLTQQLQDGIA